MRAMRAMRAGPDDQFYYIGQRVILNDYEIGVVVVPERDLGTNGIWVMSPSAGYAAFYARHSVKPLPDGQL